MKYLHILVLFVALPLFATADTLSECLDSYKETIDNLTQDQAVAMQKCASNAVDSSECSTKIYQEFVPNVHNVVELVRTCVS